MPFESIISHINLDYIKEEAERRNAGNHSVTFLNIFWENFAYFRIHAVLGLSHKL